jgi:hypothetical protein
LLVAMPERRARRLSLSQADSQSSDARYAAFFFELDSWTEYWDIYRPHTCGQYYFGDGETTPGYLSSFLPSPRTRRAPVFSAWKTYALAAGDPVAEPRARGCFEAEVREAPAVHEAARAVEWLVNSIVQSHFGEPPDRLAYFEAIERFARNQLPPTPDRLARVPDDDLRKATALHHTMDGDIMWFAWAVHLECAHLLGSHETKDDLQRALLMAGVILGCSMDYAFSGRCRTRREYQSQDETARKRILERANACAEDFQVASAEARRLFFIRTFGDA